MSGLFRDSAHEMRNLHAVVLTAQFAALQIVASMFTITLLPWARISFSFVFQAATGMLFGPVLAGMQGVVADMVGYMLHAEGPFFPGYTLQALLAGLVYGCAFYRAKMNWKRALCAKGVVNILLNLGLGTLWSVILYHKGFWLILPDRMLKNLAMLPIEVALLVGTYEVLQRIKKSRGL